MTRCDLGNQVNLAMEMAALRCRHFSFRTSQPAHTSIWCCGGVTEACAFRQLRGTGSIPVHGSNKTNDEVVAKLLTWKWRARKTSSSQDRQGNLSVLLYLTLIAVFSSWRNAVWKFQINLAVKNDGTPVPSFSISAPFTPCTLPSGAVVV